RALVFGTAPMGFRAGFLHGRVTDFATDDPIEGAHVYTDYEFETVTDADGKWEFYEALAEQPYSITATFPEYNDSSYTDFQMNDRDTIEVNFALLHPEFEPSTREISTLLDSNWTDEISFNIQNTGNGPLDWSLKRTLPENADFDPWEQRLSHPASEITGDTRVVGVVFIDDMFYVSGANSGDGGDSTNMIYVINSEGELERRFPQPGESHFGMKDLAWDGELIWGTSDNHMIGFTTDGDSIISFETPEASSNVLAWDTDREIMWVARRTGNAIFAINNEGNAVDSLELPRFGLRLYGLSYWTDDPDGYTLYIFSSPDNSTQVIHKVNPDTKDSLYVATLEPEGGGQPGGAFITNKYDVYSWVFISIANNPDDDRIDLWQVQAKRDWFRVYTGYDEDRAEPYSGRIEALETQDFILGFNSRDLDLVPFRGFLEFSHNAEDYLDVININLDIIGDREPLAFGLLTPEDGDTLDANADTTVVHFSWQESIEYNHLDTLRYHLWLEVDTCLRSIVLEDNYFDIDIITLADSLGLSVEVAFPLKWWVQAVSAGDTVDCDTSFHLQFLPNALPNENAGIPIEFGLQTIYPSPFNSTTTVRFGIDKNDRARLHVYDLTGRQVTTLFDRSQAIGNHRVVWDASLMPSGLYIMRLESAGRQEVRKVALIR
ncbi:MAG: carboxypeptidase regulatory-like domain-containing protein, partial [Calditrichaeota bacterium]|nr:carboxypeptidase regulatory-like domain-containing protein [Calditrichota bacterium]